MMVKDAGKKVTLIGNIQPNLWLEIILVAAIIERNLG